MKKDYIRGSSGGKKTVALYGKEHMVKLAKKRWRKERKLKKLNNNHEKRIISKNK